MNLELIKPQNLGSLLMKSSQSNFNLRSPGSYLVRSYQITTVITARIIQVFLKRWHRCCCLYLWKTTIRQNELHTSCDRYRLDLACNNKIVQLPTCNKSSHHAVQPLDSSYIKLHQSAGVSSWILSEQM